MSAGLAKLRAAFREMKAKLHNAGIKHQFDTPAAAEIFYEQITNSSTKTAEDA